MPVEMAIWRMTESGLRRLDSTPIETEQRLEEAIVHDPTLVGLELLVIGRQVATAYGGFIDVLAVDSDGRLHVIELKRNRTPRDVIAQTLDYASWVQGLSLDEVNEIYSAKHNGVSFDDAFAECFDQPLPDVFNADQQLTVVAAELDPASERIIEYLAQGFHLPLNAVFFRHFVDEGNAYLARTWLLSPQEAATDRSDRRKIRPWNQRDFYVVLGNVEQGFGRWDLAREHGLVSAGGGSWYWKPLRNLTPGKRVFAYIGGTGYVGVGQVTGAFTPGTEVTVPIDGTDVPLVDVPNLPSDIRERILAGDPEQMEYVVPVLWAATRRPGDAVSESGLFASQVTVCKLRDERTIGILESAFGLSDLEL